MKGFATSIYHKNNTKEKKNAGLDVTCILRDIFRCFLQNPILYGFPYVFIVHADFGKSCGADICSVRSL